jgi:predicted phosphodiesterase
LEDVNRKWDELFQVALDKGCDNLIIPGDILDKTTPSDYTFVTIQRLEERFTKLRQVFNKIYTIPGNHDLPNSSPDMKDRSVYSYLSRMGWIDDIDGKIVSVGDRVNLVGVGFQVSLEKTMSEIRRLHSELKDSDFNIALVHEHFLPFGVTHKFLNYLPYESLIEFPKLSMFLMGHLHSGYDLNFISRGAIEGAEPQYYVNPWNMVRMSRANPDHVPQYVFCEVVDGKLMALEQTQFKSARPYDEAFVVAEDSPEFALSMDISEFVGDLQKFYVETTGIPSDIPEELRSMIEDYLERAKQEVA